MRRQSPVFVRPLWAVAFFGLALAACNSPSAKEERIAGLAAQYRKGQLIYKQHCDRCHAAPERHTWDGYKLDRIFDQLPPPPEAWFVRFVADSRALKASGDLHALELDSVYGVEYEHNFRDRFTVHHYEAIINYLRVAAKQ